MTSKLALYNEALGHLEERSLASLSEDREPRRVLDDYYDANLRFTLEQGFWNFAMRVVQVDKSNSVVPTFGYGNAFAKPTDWIRTYQMSASEYFNPPLLSVVDEPNFWYADIDPLYVRYVSSDSAYGGDLSVWPETFANFFAIRLARQACIRITSSGAFKAELKDDHKRALADARSKDAMNEPPAFRPRDTWASSRNMGSTSSGYLNGRR